MKHAAAIAFLALLFCAARASWDSLDSVHLSSELDAVNEEIIPRLLQEVLGDAALPGAYGAATPTAAAVEKATPDTPAAPAEVPVTTTITPIAVPETPVDTTSTNVTPAAVPETPVDTTTTTVTPAETPVDTPTATTTPTMETPVTPVVQPTQPTIVETPTAIPAAATAAEAVPAAEPATTTTTITTTTTTDAAAPATVAVIPAEASACPAGSTRTDYSSGTMFCVLAAQGASEGEVHIANGAGRAIPSGNKCFAAPCAASPSSSTGRKMLRWLHATESVQAQQRAEFLPFLLAVARAIQPVQMSAASTLAHSKCFYVCEAQA